MIFKLSKPSVIKVKLIKKQLINKVETYQKI